MQTPTVLLCILTGLLLLNSCAVTIHDAQFCSPIPGGLGAVCDNFLSQNQKILSAEEWQALQAEWIASGQSVECTPSNTIGDVKGEIEKLCSLVKCDYQTKKKIVSGLKKLQALGRNQTLDVR